MITNKLTRFKNEIYTGNTFCKCGFIVVFVLVNVNKTNCFYNLVFDCDYDYVIVIDNFIILLLI